MMLLYLDSSALVKRYIDEAHSEAVARLLDETVAIATSAISRVEVGAALARAARGNRLNTRAETLAWKHGLRAYDAVQLAAALVCEEALTNLDENILFACFDDELTAAANDEGLRTWAD